MFPGLCSDCLHARVIENRRGSRFWLCARSRFDPRFRRYPPLPVIACAGFEARAADVTIPFVMEGEDE